MPPAYDRVELERELARRRGLIGSLFERQRAAHDDPARRKTYETSRRSGKSRGLIQDFIDDGLRHPGSAYGYAALTQDSVKDIVWAQILQEVDRTHRLGLVYRESALTVEIPGGSYLRFFGADKRGWHTRIHGTKFRKFAVDEAAHFSINLRYLVEDAIWPTLMDLQGQLILASTPGPVRSGYFWEACRESKHGFVGHRWTAADNPFVREQYLREVAELRAANPDIDQDPIFQRNYLGEWAADPKGRVFAYDPERNALRNFTPEKDARFLCVVDFGWTHSSAYTVSTWGPSSPDLVVLEAWKEPKLTIDKLCLKLETLRARFPGLRFLADPRHRQLLESVAERMGVPVEAAEKTDQLDTVKLFNTDLTLGRIKLVRPESDTLALATELADLQWLEGIDGTYRMPKVGDDCSDTALYAFRHSYHYRYTPREAKPEAGSREAVQAEAEAMKAKRFAAQKQRGKWWERSA